jgi:hypothetical protein
MLIRHRAAVDRFLLNEEDESFPGSKDEVRKGLFALEKISAVYHGVDDNLKDGFSEDDAIFRGDRQLTQDTASAGGKVREYFQRTFYRAEIVRDVLLQRAEVHAARAEAILLGKKN